MDEEKLPGAETAAGEITAPVLPEKPRFSATGWEILAAALCYGLGWIWFWILEISFSDWEAKLWSFVFVLGFAGLGELLHRDTRRPRESWIWLGCVAVLTAALLLERGNAWSDDADNRNLAVGFFLHIFAVWWLLSRSGRLCEGESGHMLPYDALNGFILFPFRHFFLRIRCLWYGLSLPFKNHARPKTETVLWSCAAVVAALLLFAKAVSLLMTADAGFDSLLSGIADWFRWDPDFDWFRLFFSLPVGAYVFGLLAGTAREDAERLRERGASIRRALWMLHKVPELVYLALLSLFSLLYLAFFLLQGSYLFGAFTRTLPEGFVVAEYARQGFFELCRVMAVNFALLWLVARTAGKPLRQSLPLKIAALVLLAESLVFAVIAASKLWLYIDCFGFTPLRLQSAWLICLLFFGCLCAAYSVLTGKKSFRVWMVYGAVSLSLLCLY